ncbi:MAG TPA: glycosyltransferase family 39 protein, partial [Candidatus Limnocylindrales bacterium]
PADLPEWGGLRPFQADYLPVTAHTAAAFQLLPGDMLVHMEIYRVVLLVATVVLATLLFRRWVSSWVALLGAMLLVSTVRLDAKFLSYKPETWALALALFTLWLADRALAERSRRLALTAAAAATIVFLAHAEVFLVLVAALVGVAAGRTLVAPGGGPAGAGGLGARHGRRFGLRRRYRMASFRPVATTLAIVLGAVVAGAALNAALVGEFRLLGYVAHATPVDTTPVLTRPTELPAGWRFSSDPTWDFYVAAVAPAEIGNAPPSSFTDRQLLPRTVLDIWPGLDARSRSFLVILLGLLAIPVLAWPALDARRQRLLVTWAVFAVALGVGAYLLFRLSSTYVPRRVGPRRLVPYELFIPVVAGMVALWLLDRVARPGWQALVPARRAMLPAGLALAVVATGMVSPAPSTGLEADDDSAPGLTPIGYEAYRWIEANTPPTARILANAYTDGSIAALTERTGIVDGRAVYLENRQFLAESTLLVLGARVVFADPTGPGATSYLDREAVDYLLVAGPGATGADLGGYRPFDTNLAALAAGGRYTLVRTFGEGRLLLYTVRPT